MPDITKLAAQLRAAIARFNAADRGPGGYGLEDYGPAWRELNALCAPANLTTLLDALDALRVDAEKDHADAERYRWLRRETNWFSNNSGERIEVRAEPHLWDDAIDRWIEKERAAIDAARKAQP